MDSITDPKTTPKPSYLIRMAVNGVPLVTIEHDGKVTIHNEGADKEAARIFYEQVEIQGTTLVKEVTRWRTRALNAEDHIASIIAQQAKGAIN